LLAGYNISSSPETGDKQLRARPFAAQCNVGNVSLAGGGWVDAYRDELRSFPHGKYDDQVDASSRAFMELASARAPMEISSAAVALIANPMTWCDGFPVRAIDSMGVDATARFDDYINPSVH
jgi:hypothetical protein